MSSLDLFIVNLAFPYIGLEYRGTSLSSLSWVLNGYTIVFAAVLVPAGRWADRIGRRRVFVAGLIGFSVGSLLCGVAPGVAALIAARVIQAAGAGLMVPASLSLLLAAVPGPARPRAIGTWSALGALGAALGPVIGGSLVEISWRWALAGGAALVARSRRHHAPVIELGLLRSRTFSGTFVASILYYAAFGAFVLNSVEFLTGVWHYSAVRAGLAIGPGPLMVLLAGWIGGPGRVAVIGCVVNAGSQLLWYSQIQVHPAYLTHLLPAQLLGGAGVGLTIPSLLGAGSASLPPDRFGTGSGILNMARQVGTVLGVAGLVAILAHVVPSDPVTTYRQGLLLVVAFFAAAGAVSAALLIRRPGRTEGGS
jgi:predicted MFS family arabinose efflux permease